jgi:sugar transferase (PEP-CTERM/EpsH1 system associated)
MRRASVNAVSMGGEAAPSAGDRVVPAAATAAQAPLVAHVILHLRMGGMENGLVNLINGTPRHRYRHAVLCLQDYSEFRERIRDPDVPVIAIGKQPGKDPKHYWSVLRELRRLRPAIVHTRNLPGLDIAALAALARVPVRVHGEHGWDVSDLHGTNRRFRRYRRLVRPFVTRYVSVSRDIAGYLGEAIHVPATRISQIYNGVDTRSFRPRKPGEPAALPAGFAKTDSVVIGTVGRLQAVKDQRTLVRAVAQLHSESPVLAERLRLVLLGDGPERAPLEAEIARAGLTGACWLPGARDDVPAVMRSLDVFVLPSLNEGISNTILEAMACGLPVVATRVGGNPELVEEGASGMLFPVGDAPALAACLRLYVEDPDLRRAHGTRGRARAEQQFSLDSMVASYLAMYDQLLSRGSAAAPR